MTSARGALAENVCVHVFFRVADAQRLLSESSLCRQRSYHTARDVKCFEKGADDPGEDLAQKRTDGVAILPILTNDRRWCLDSTSRTSISKSHSKQAARDVGKPSAAAPPFAVGTALSGGPPHRSRRAELPHRAPAAGHDAQALSVRRASHVEFCDRQQIWSVREGRPRGRVRRLLQLILHQPLGEIVHWAGTREEALTWERRYYEPGGPGWTADKTPGNAIYTVDSGPTVPREELQ